MAETLDLDDEVHLGSQQVRDKPSEQRHLPAERDTDTPAAERLKEPRLGGRRRAAHLGCTPREHALSPSGDET
jgi:hypothetical protein